MVILNEQELGILRWMEQKFGSKFKPVVLPMAEVLRELGPIAGVTSAEEAMEAVWVVQSYGLFSGGINEREMKGHITASGRQELRARSAEGGSKQGSQTIRKSGSPSGIRAFLGYSSKDRKLAGEIKDHLEGYGFRVFLAHEDIEPSVEWQQRILSELKETEVFLPLLTKSFRDSQWTDQESGIAVANGCKVVPICVGVTPYGFVARFQGHNLDSRQVSKGCAAIVKGLFVHESLQAPIRDSLIAAVSASKSYEEAKLAAANLVAFEGFSPKQLNALLKASVENNEVFESWGAQSSLGDLFSQNRAVLDGPLMAKWDLLVGGKR